ncbi:MAG TPA: lysine--tRNA ligase [Candidatus Paceibacterota bacterium]|nr:lysine--tRNA ligase [Candidatus Paceibacterota bacterium]HMP18928.1 lysine--tRNA ligase [Candidatus Paceibacterota bacterium]HMP85091.1 lysine--tRNA ligase [Candidatus Paceibacterota bacterium]
MQTQDNNQNTKTGREEKTDRLKKIELIKQMGINPYADKYDRKHTIADCLSLEIDSDVKTAGRIVLSRNMGKMGFCQIIDHSGKIQLVFKSGEIDSEEYKKFFKITDIGDFVGVEGKRYKTQKGEESILVKNFTFLSKALRPLPEKWHGLKDVETKYRKRYLDLISNRETFDRFKFKSDFIWEIRKFYKENGFDEIQTPVLSNSASGALAKPFKTHYNALDLDVYLRIAPEIFLKEAIIGGFDKIFEVARVFRNEGMDASHLQEFDMIEHYCAYWDFHDNMDFTEKMLTTVISKLKKDLKIKTYNRDEELIEVDLSLPWKKVSFRELLISDCGIDIDQYKSVEDLRKVIIEKNIKIDDIEKLGRGNLIDSLYKKVSRPKLINPTFLTNHPLDLSPLARQNNQNNLIVDRFQLVINGWEIVNAYSELIDPVDQKERFEKQMQAKEAGDEEAMSKDDDYVEAMEYGMPPISGWGMGIERIVALLTEQKNLRDVVLFPLLKPKEEK